MSWLSPCCPREFAATQENSVAVGTAKQMLREYCTIIAVVS